MKYRSHTVLALFCIIPLLVSCGASQAEREAIQTQTAGDVVATLTAEAPTATATSEPTDTPTITPSSTSTSVPTPTRKPTATPKPTDTPAPTPTFTSTPRPTAAPATATPEGSEQEEPAVAPPTPTTAPPPAGDVDATFILDAVQTFADVQVIQGWFNQMVGGSPVYCETTFAHSIHYPVSDAPSQVPELQPIWGEYLMGISEAQIVLDWCWDFCKGGGGKVDRNPFFERRDHIDSANSHMEHVMAALGLQP